MNQSICRVGPNKTHFGLEMSHWVKAFEKNERNESLDKTVCWGLECQLDRESLLGVSVYFLSSCTWNKVIAVSKHVFFQIN